MDFMIRNIKKGRRMTDMDLNPRSRLEAARADAIMGFMAMTVKKCLLVFARLALITQQELAAD